MSFSPRLPAAEFLTAEQLNALRERSTLRGLWMIAHAWTLIAGSIALVAFFPNPFTFLLAVMVIGSRQLGLAILMHDGAHGCLAKDPDTNLLLSQWLCAYPVWSDIHPYRSYHLQHHAKTWTKDDPDIGLVLPFPITRSSLRRKIWRDQESTATKAISGRRARPISRWPKCPQSICICSPGKVARRR